MIELIPEACLKLLPLSREPLRRWDQQSDLLALLRALYVPHDFPSYGDHLFNDEVRRSSLLASDFRAAALKVEPPPAAQDFVEPIPEFLDDDAFGLMAKYYGAWRAAVGALLEESGFFSLAHVLEAENDLDASVLLSSRLYYKQAILLLRGYLEGLLLQLRFCATREDFDRWKRSDYRVPRMRGKGGLLEQLVNDAILPPELAATANELYAKLCGSIHGAEAHLTYTGIFKGRHVGDIFTRDRFTHWCNLFAECVDVGLHALRLSSILWLRARPRNEIYCDVCHAIGMSVFDVDESSLGAASFVCRQCGNRFNYRATWASERGYCGTK